MRPCLYKKNKSKNSFEAGPGHGLASGQGRIEGSLTTACSHSTRTSPGDSWKFWMLFRFWRSCSRHRAGSTRGSLVVPVVATDVLVLASGFWGRLGIVVGTHFASPLGGLTCRSYQCAQHDGPCSKPSSAPPAMTFATATIIHSYKITNSFLKWTKVFKK